MLTKQEDEPDIGYAWNGDVGLHGFRRWCSSQLAKLANVHFDLTGQLKDAAQLAPLCNVADPLDTVPANVVAPVAETEESGTLPQALPVGPSVQEEDTQQESEEVPAGQASPAQASPAPDFSDHDKDASPEEKEAPLGETAS